ncbi:hypothetical protein [Streptomyces sp. NPDC056491]|uniref:hypothetical protein n=1 Tax=Streptomyces sp. NPDC056491 TaxID=3345837 RepID=UPI0036B715C1
MRRIRARAALGALALAALTTATATACAHPLRDLGPLPPRFSGPPMSADTAVGEMTAVLAAEGIAVRREPSNLNGMCSERLSGHHAQETAAAAFKAALARARSEHGWQDDPNMGWESQNLLRKGNWTVAAGFSGDSGPGPQALVLVSLNCVDAGEGAATAPAPSSPSLAPAPAAS